MGLLKFTSANLFLPETIYLQGSTSIWFWNALDYTKKTEDGETAGKWHEVFKPSYLLPALALPRTPFHITQAG